MRTDGSYIQNKSLLKAIAILNSFSPDEPELSATEVSLKTNISKMTTHRILSTLNQSGFLERDMVSGKYCIGPAVYMMGSLYLRTTNITKAAEPVMKAINEFTGEVISLAIRNKEYVTMVLREESVGTFRWGIHIGSVFPAYAPSSGKALLAELSDEEIDELFPEENLPPVTNNTITTKTALKIELEDVRQNGVAFSSEEHYNGVVAIGSVVRNADGKAVAALAFGIPIFKINQEYRTRLAGLIKLGCSLVSYRLGYRDMENPIKNVQELRSWWEAN